ncbi:MAG: polysaccharide deacetylase family protein [Flavobacterium sp.]|nr:polysaccharide deacetylase family protein [Flavobacterium sp.]
MKFYWIKTNAFVKKLFRYYVWDVPNTENKIYLTFDDGPTPEITEWVLKELQKYNAKATFFCIGNNIEKHPQIFGKVTAKGHSIGNHTFNHLNGWKSSNDEYLENSKRCEAEMVHLKSEICHLFRPPYGKIKASQAKRLHQHGYKIIMWDVLSADFDHTISKEKCLENVIQNVKSGSIIVFHDSVKAFPHLEYTLPRALKYWNEKKFVFEKLA